MVIKEYGVPVVRLHDIYQIMLYISNGILPIDEYVSRNKKGDPILIHVFKKENTSVLFSKYRNKELDFDVIYNR